MSIGNLKTDGGKGTNYPYQSKVLFSLNRIGNLIGATTTEFEAQLVIDNASVVWLEVRVYDPDTETFAAPIYFPPGSSTPGVPAAPVVYLAPAAPQTRTTNISRVTNAATIAAGAFSISFANVHATVDSTVKTVVLKAGETITFDGGAMNNTLDAIPYVATGSELLIISVT